MFDEDADFDWTSKRGWRVVRLDAARCENVVQRKIVYPGLQTYEGFQAVIANSGGMDSPGYWAMARGCFPPTGTSMSVIPPGLLNGIRVDPIWYEDPAPVGACDLAFEGGDVAVFFKGSYGLAAGIRLAPSLDHPAGRTVMFRDSKGRQRPRPLLVVEAMLKLPKGDTIAMADEVKRVATSFGIRAEHLCLDKTGAGLGTYDLVRSTWPEVIGVNYSEGATETKIMEEDSQTCDKAYGRVNSELWFAARKLIEFGFVKFGMGLTFDNLQSELTGRRYRLRGKTANVEAKKDYKARNAGRSPDEADAFTLLVHTVRRAFSLVGAMNPENAFADPTGDYGDDGPDWHRVDATNRFEDL